jgi:hypothetical protein
MRQLFILLAALVTGLGSCAQIRKTPASVSTAFEKQYPAASKVQYEDNLFNVLVHFVLDSGKMVAKYDSDGNWKETEKESSYESLPADIKTGFEKSKFFADWKVKQTSILYLPQDEIRYRLRIEKNDVAKKYLFFDKSGRLIKDAMTI